MISNTNTLKVGSSIYIRAPPHIVEYLDLETKTDLKIKDDVGKHGEFISIWRADQNNIDKDGTEKK